MQLGREKGREPLAPVSSRFSIFFWPADDLTPPIPPPPRPTSELCVLLYERLKQATQSHGQSSRYSVSCNLLNVLTLDLGICLITGRFLQVY